LQLAVHVGGLPLGQQHMALFEAHEPLPAVPQLVPPQSHGFISPALPAPPPPLEPDDASATLADKKATAAAASTSQVRTAM
jgi:hypothetical protein